MKSIESKKTSLWRRFDPAQTDSLRKRLLDQENTRFVDKQEFGRLLVSFRRLERFNVVPARLHGLQDRDNGIRYLIEDEKLFAPERVGLSATV